MVWLDSGVLLDLAHGGNDSNFLEAALAAAKEQVSGGMEPRNGTSAHTTRPLPSAAAMPLPHPRVPFATCLSLDHPCLISQGGVLSDLTAKSLTDLTHPKMFEYFEKKWGWSQERFTSLDPVVTNCNGAFSAWSEEGEIGQQAMDRWEECSMDKVRRSS